MQITIDSPSKYQLSQRDRHWINHNIGGSDLTVGGYGCLLTCASMISAEFGGYKDPAQIAANTFLFTPDGLFYWTRVQKFVPVLSFAWRQYDFSPATIANFLVPGKKASVLKVAINPARQQFHWLKVVGIVKTKKGMDYLCNDPWTGRQCYALLTYGKILGSGHFIKA